jgi:uncharacterized repeat protein (TIGR02543 family)
MAIVTVNGSGGADYTSIYAAANARVGTTWTDDLIINCSGATADTSLEGIQLRISTIGTQNGFKLIINGSSTYQINITTYVRNRECHIDFNDLVFYSTSTASSLWFIYSTYASQTLIKNAKYILPANFGGMLSYSAQTSGGWTHVEDASVRGPSGTGTGHQFDTASTFTANRCTIGNFASGFRCDGSSTLQSIINCAVLECTSNFYNITATYVSYCATTDGFGSNAATVSDWTDVFVNKDTGDYTLLETDTLLTGKGSTGNNIGYYQSTATSFSVTYNGNSNTSGTVPEDATMYSTADTVTVLTNSGSLLRSGYTFDGWNTASDGSGTDRAINSTFEMGSANVILYAKWNLETTRYSVTYDGNSNTTGTVPVDANTYQYTDTVTILTNSGSLTKTPASFSGWNSQANTSGTDYTPGNTFTMPIGDLTLYAKWIMVTFYNVLYPVNNAAWGSITGNNNQSIVSGGNCTQVTAVPTSGYMFLGWKNGDDIRTESRTDTNITADKTITAMFGLIDTITSGSATFGTSGRYIDLVHAEKNIGNTLTGNVTLNGLSDTEIYTRTNFGEGKNFAGYTLEVNNNGYEFLGTGSRQHLYVINCANMPYVIMHDFTLRTEVITSYAYIGCYPQISHTIFEIYNSKMIVEGAAASHPFYLYGGNHDGQPLGNTSLLFRYYNSSVAWLSSGLGSELFETAYSTPQLTLDIENVIAHSNSALVRFRALGALLGTVKNSSFLSLRDACYEDYGQTATNVMTTDATGTIDNVVPLEQYISLDPTSPNYLIPVTSSTADVGGSIPLLSTVDMNGNTWYTPYSIGPVQAYRASPTYTVTFDSQSATSASIPTSIDVESPATTVVTLPTNPIKTGYTFGGWWTGTNGSGTRFYSDTVVSAPITVYAKWNIITYNITYTLNDGTNNPSNPTTYTVESSLITFLAGTKDNYYFKEWSIPSIPTGSSGDITNIAMWDNVPVFQRDWYINNRYPGITNNTFNRNLPTIGKPLRSYIVPPPNNPADPLHTYFFGGSIIPYGQIVIGNAWKTISEVYIVISGVWKTVTSVQTVKTGVWKDLNL